MSFIVQSSVSNLITHTCNLRCPKDILCLVLFVGFVIIMGTIAHVGKFVTVLIDFTVSYVGCCYSFSQG